MPIDWLSFLGFLTVTAEKGIAIEISYSDIHSLLFSWVSYCDNRNRVFIIAFDTKVKEHQNTRQSHLSSEPTLPRTNQIASYFDALSVKNRDIN
jgi:hypothetical protein